MLSSIFSRSLRLNAKSIAGSLTQLTPKVSFSSDYFYEDRISYPTSQAFIGFDAPSFDATIVTDDNELVDYSFEPGRWTLLLFYPKDFTYVCPTELIAFSDRLAEFKNLDTDVLAISTDTPEVHLAWKKTPRSAGGIANLQVPLVADVTKEISCKYGVLDENAGIAFRGLFLIDPSGTLQSLSVNNFPVGRSVDEALRLIQAFQFVEQNGEVCPANWKPGDKTMVGDPEESQEYFSSTYNDNNEASASSDASSNSAVDVITSLAEVERIVAAEPKVVIDFMADWCGKCQMIDPTVQRLGQEYASSVKVIKVDTSAGEGQEIASKYDVDVLPTFQFFKGGEAFGESVVGYKQNTLRKAIKKLRSA
jgi:peroxiredoxin (alkyl hydroperoxide reductase subunit C)